MNPVYRYVLCVFMGWMSVLSVCSRTVLSESTKAPVIYASVGVVNRNVGTVTDSLGRFSLNIRVKPKSRCINFVESVKFAS